MLTVWGRATSSNVQAVMWTIAELGLDCERHDRGHVHGGLDTPEFLAMNPNGLVPVLRDGDDEPIWESAAIVRYLAARYGDDAFWPKDAAARAQIDKWTEWAKISVSMAFTGPIFWQVVRVPPAQRDAELIAANIAKLDPLLDIAEAQLGQHAFLVGGTLTVADIMFGHLLFRYFDLEIDRRERPALRRYYDMLCERPAYREHVMVSYDSLRAR